MSFLQDLTLQEIFARGVAYFAFAAIYGLILGLCLHTASRPRPTGNPITHTSVWGLFMAILFQAGWVRAPAVAPIGRGRLIGAMLVPTACLLALIPLIDLARPLIPWGTDVATGRFAQILASQLQDIFLGSALLELIPWPILSGRLLLLALRPALAARLSKWEGPATAILVAAMIYAFDPDWFQQAMGALSLTR